MRTYINGSRIINEGKTIMYNTIIIGGGAAGMTAAVFSAANGGRTALIEPNPRLGKKLAITGKGRCNVTNNCDMQTMMKNLPRNSSFMYSALSGFSAQDTIDFIEGLGVPLKTERGNRVFPVSDKAGDIVSALSAEINKRNVAVIHDKAVEIQTDNGAVTGVKTAHGVYRSEKVILATGGMSYPLTGSTGDGYRMAKALGHTVTALKPSLVPIVTEEDVSEANGLLLKNVTLSLIDCKSGKTLFSELGEMQMTDYGVSGALTLSASSYITSAEQCGCKFLIDLKPGLDEKKLDARILRDFSEASDSLGSKLCKLLPNQMISLVLSAAQLDREKRTSEVTREERLRLIKAVKSFPLTVKRLRPIDEAIITDGGINVKEINPKTMESRLVKGLFFAGEIIDVTGFTGGFNLQIAFSTAYAAANG